MSDLKALLSQAEALSIDGCVTPNVVRHFAQEVAAALPAAGERGV